jgi:hypothetical protein
VSQDRFEAQILKLWMTTRIPFTRPTLQVATGLSRKRLEKRLDALCAAGVLDVDVDDAGEMVYAVRGAARPRGGPESIAELEKVSELKQASRALVRAGKAAGALAGRGRGGGGDGDQKSLVAAGALSFFLGPLGWLYSAPLSAVAPAAIGFLLAVWFLPHFLLVPLLTVGLPASALVGISYAWRHNNRG